MSINVLKGEGLMKPHFNLLNRSAKKRIIIFTIITVIEAVFAVLRIRAVYLCANIADGLTVFGIVDFIDLLIDSFTAILVAGVSLVHSWVINLAVFIAFGELAFKKDTFVSNTEYILAKRILTVILIISIVVLLYFTLFNNSIYLYFFIYIYAAVLMFPIGLFGYLFYINKLKDMRQE